MDLAAFLWKCQRKVFGRYLGLLFYQGRITADRKVLPLKSLGPINQWLTEHGYTTPWLMTRRECQEFWKGMSNDEPFSGNHPEAYASKPQDIVRFLHEFWKPYVGYEDSILELGCNCGANLYGLNRLGYQHLNGIEINEHAVSHMAHAFPDLAKRAVISLGSVEEMLPKAETRSIDVIFSMAVLLHVHPTSNSVFDEMVRVARKYICVIEAEVANCSYVFARNYKRVFQRRGWSEIKSVLLTKDAFPDMDSNYYGYAARLFHVPR